MIRIAPEKINIRISYLETIEEIGFSFIVSLNVDNPHIREQNVKFISRLFI